MWTHLVLMKDKGLRITVIPVPDFILVVSNHFCDVRVDPTINQHGSSFRSFKQFVSAIWSRVFWPSTVYMTFYFAMHSIPAPTLTRLQAKVSFSVSSPTIVVLISSAIASSLPAASVVFIPLCLSPPSYLSRPLSSSPLVSRSGPPRCNWLVLR